MELYRFREGRSALLVSMPHTGTHVPAQLRKRLTPAALALPDTDWHLERLYDFLEALGASTLIATHSRYVVDLNRPADGASLYPGQDTTGVVPLDTFHKASVYRRGEAPGADEAGERIERYWMPYHRKLQEAIAAVKARHGYALLWDAHSIFSVLPRFFEGRLADLNLGTAGGSACRPGIGEALLASAHPAYTAVLNGRFKGGYITRRYGDPKNGVQAVQLELSEATYMDEAPPYGFRDDLAAGLRPQLRALLECFVRLGRPQGKD